MQSQTQPGFSMLNTEPLPLQNLELLLNHIQDCFNITKPALDKLQAIKSLLQLPWNTELTRQAQHAIYDKLWTSYQTIRQQIQGSMKTRLRIGHMALLPTAWDLIDLAETSNPGWTWRTPIPALVFHDALSQALQECKRSKVMKSEQAEMESSDVTMRWDDLTPHSQRSELEYLGSKLATLKLWRKADKEETRHFNRRRGKQVPAEYYPKAQELLDRAVWKSDRSHHQNEPFTEDVSYTRDASSHGRTSSHPLTTDNSTAWSPQSRQQHERVPTVETSSCPPVALGSPGQTMFDLLQFNHAAPYSSSFPNPEFDYLDHLHQYPSHNTFYEPQAAWSHPEGGQLHGSGSHSFLQPFPSQQNAYTIPLIRSPPTTHPFATATDQSYRNVYSQDPGSSETPSHPPFRPQRRSRHEVQRSTDRSRSPSPR